MYNHIRGTVISCSPGRVVIEAGGVGYDVTVPLSATPKTPKPGQEVTVLTHLVVREDMHQLIGFFTEESRTLFRKLISLQGVGPSLALQVVGAVTPGEFALAVERQDATYLKRIKGIGGKKANQILLGLKGAKLHLSPDAADGAPSGLAADAVAALQTMGMQEREALARVNKVITEHPDAGLEDLIKKALR